MKSGRTKGDLLGIYSNKRKGVVAFVDLALFFGSKFEVNDQSESLKFKVEGLTIIFKKVI